MFYNNDSSGASGSDAANKDNQGQGNNPDKQEDKGNSNP